MTDQDEQLHQEGGRSVPSSVELGSLQPASANGGAQEPARVIQEATPEHNTSHTQAADVQSGFAPHAADTTALAPNPEEQMDADPAPLPPSSSGAASPPMLRKASEAIGPPTELPIAMLDAEPSAQASGAVVQFTLLLASTGTRHPFQLNERYLAKRNVSALDSEGKFDPASISIYSLKELILKDWRDGKRHQAMGHHKTTRLTHAVQIGKKSLRPRRRFDSSSLVNY